MSKPNVLIATPAYNGCLFVDYVTSLLKTKPYLESKGIQQSIAMISNESLVPRARNTIVAKFMSNPKFTHLLYIDADISWQPQDIELLLSHNKSIIGACYPKKKLHINRCKELIPLIEELVPDKGEQQRLLQSKLVDYVMNFSKEILKQDGSLLRMKHIGTGFMLIQRETIQKMMDEYPYLKYDDDHGVLTPEENKWLYALFDTDIHETHYLSEDYLFCKRWQDIGGEVWAETKIGLSHTGTYKFEGHFGNSLLDLNKAKQLKNEHEQKEKEKEAEAKVV